MSDSTPKAKLPSAVQVGISQSTYSKLLVYPHCARLGRECKSVCQPLDDDGTYRVELDHIVAKSTGGTNALDNLQWLCASENRKKYNRPDSRYKCELYFDGDIDVTKLRPHQLSLGFDKARRAYKELFVAPERLLSRFMLLAWMVGAGKTIAMMAVLFGINQVRKNLNGGSAKRIKRVLWLVHQRSLVKSLADELRSELTYHKIAKTAPTVYEVKSKAHWGYLADIIVACPQALWDSEGNSISDLERAAILSEFDAIVVDEAQFAVDRYIEICKLAPTAFKFAVTATPMNAVGQMFYEMDGGAYRDWFTLFSAFGYNLGRDMGIYKELVPFYEGESNEWYSEEEGGTAGIRVGSDVVDEANTKTEINLCRNMALIRRARVQAIALSQHTNFDHHIMVRAGSISQAKALAKALESDGDICVVYSGSKGKLLGDNDHPWMLAKKHNGRIPENGKRIVIVVDIGQFGINNRYCSIIVWIEPNTSMIEIIQRIGRAIRRGPDQDDSEIRLYWSSAKSDQMRTGLARSIDYMLNMESKIVGFVSMSELADTNPVVITPLTEELPIKPVDRVRIASKIGSGLLDGMTPDEATDGAIDWFKAETPNASERYLDQVGNYANKLQDPEFRLNVLQLPSILEPIRFVQEESAPPAYTIGRLIDSVNSRVVCSRISDSARAKLMNELRNDHECSSTYAEMVASELRELDEENRRLDNLSSYTAKQVLYGKKEDRLPFDSIRSKFLGEVSSAFVDYNKDRGIACAQLCKSIAALFGIPDIQEKTYQPFESAFVDALMRDHIQHMIILRAKFDLMSKHPKVVPGLAKLFERELNLDVK